MRLLKRGSHGELSLTKDIVGDTPPYAILSHTWGAEEDEVTFQDLENGSGTSKAGFAKLKFCGKQAERDGLRYFWVDTCCINKANHAELSEAITSMFRWYRDAEHCYVYLSDVPIRNDRNRQPQQTWEVAFRRSRWFTRGWTLQELIAPRSVKFFSQEEGFLGTRKILEQQIQEITGIPVTALSGSPLTQFSIEERFRWATKRNTKRKEDQAYCLLGIFNIFIPLIYGEGDHAFVRLKEEIQKRSGASEPLTHKHWMVTRHANSLFTGRGDLLLELDGIIRYAIENPLNRRQCRIVLSGMGGQGKSEICLKLAHNLRHIFWGVFWVDVSTTITAEKSFLDIAEKLSIPAQTWADARLGIANLKHPWLLVLDNADDPTVDYQDYFPDGALGVVLLTSRNHECQQYAIDRSVSLEGLSCEEAQQLLLKAARVPEDQHSVHAEDAIVVARLLQSHPLALIQAGAYVSRGHCSLAEYRQVFAQERQRLLTFRPTQGQSRYRDVYATFEASANVLDSSRTESAADALQLLSVLAAYGPNRLPLPLFEASWKGAQYIPSSNTGDDDVIDLTMWHVYRLPPFMQAATDRWDSFRLIEAINLLKAFSLVSTDNHDGFLSVSIHPLTHAWARDRQDSTEQHNSWVIAGCLVAISKYDREFWYRRGRELRPHIHALTGWDITKMFASEPVTKITSILVKCGWLLEEMGDDTKLFTFMQSLFTELHLDSRVLDSDWIAIYELSARNLIDYGRIKEAVVLMEQILKVKEQTLDNNHSSRRASQYILALAYRENGQIREAISLLKQLVSIDEQTLSKDHPNRLKSQHALAIAYRANGQVKEAVALLEQIVEIEKQILAEYHPDRLSSQHALAIAYQANGQVKEAVILLEQVVEIRKQTLAVDHPHRLSSQQVLATVYWDLGRRNIALQMMKHVVETRRQVLEEHHPNRVNSEEWLEDMENELGNQEPV